MSVSAQASILFLHAARDFSSLNRRLAVDSLSPGRIEWPPVSPCDSASLASIEARVARYGFGRHARSCDFGTVASEANVSAVG